MYPIRRHLKTYKKYNFVPESLSPQSSNSLAQIAERLFPFLIIAASFIWLWN
jgi:hypothetical protein